MSDIYLARIVSLIQEMISKREYGEIVIKMEAGKIVQIKKTESIKV